MRLPVPVGIASVALWLPEHQDTAENAVAERRVEARTARELGNPRLPVAGDVSPPEMAVLAAREALRGAGVPAAGVSLLLHAWMYYQGHDLWSPPHYIAHQLGAHAAVPIGIQQICNGGAAALELAAARLTAGDEERVEERQEEERQKNGRQEDGRQEDGPAPRYSLVTTADRFALPGFDRWRSDYGAAYGDAATAVLLRRPAAPGDLVLRALRTGAAPHLELMHRGADPFGRLPRENPTIDMRRTKRVYLREHGVEPFKKTNREMIRYVVTGALRDAGLAADDPRIRFAVLPRLARKTLDDAWIPVLGELLTAPAVDWGKETGHLGTGDLVAGLHEVVSRAALGPGEFGLLLNAGAGFTWSCAVIEAPAASG
ncbi:ketoacyl-ACP synthase III family protein [Streptomyces sp. NPDC099050]|uniref:ketoacyl-ACP synthase III family protein n=1 Tax=Streptomyces sp. NPDC099050 TaxID=3366100 RepID=UPI00382108BD